MYHALQGQRSGRDEGPIPPAVSPTGPLSPKAPDTHPYPALLPQTRAPNLPPSHCAPCRDPEPQFFSSAPLARGRERSLSLLATSLRKDSAPASETTPSTGSHRAIWSPGRERLPGVPCGRPLGPPGGTPFPGETLRETSPPPATPQAPGVPWGCGLSSRYNRT